MVQRYFVAVCLAGLSLGGCVVQVDAEGGDLADLKPEDASERVGADIGSSQQAHALHYTDATNQWNEPNFPMGTLNPNCMDWDVYDRYLSARPKIGFSSYSTLDTNHPYAQGDYVNLMLATLPAGLGYTDALKQQFIFRNSESARASGKCSGRYIFAFDNRTNFGPFGANSYMMGASLPSFVSPPNKVACLTQLDDRVAAVLVDLYVCEAPATASADVTRVGPGVWCSRQARHWRLAASKAKKGGTWSGSACSVSANVSYTPPAGQITVAVNLVVKAGIGHAVAPANIGFTRAN